MRYTPGNAIPARPAAPSTASSTMRHARNDRNRMSGNIGNGSCLLHARESRDIVTAATSAMPHGRLASQSAIAAISATGADA